MVVANNHDLTNPEFYRHDDFEAKQQTKTVLHSDHRGFGRVCFADVFEGQVGVGQNLHGRRDSRQLQVEGFREETQVGVQLHHCRGLDEVRV